MNLIRNIFGPSQEEIWRKLCEETGADYIKGGIWKGDRVQLHVRNWTVTLDIYTVSTGKSQHSYTRIRAPYYNKDSFRFMISRRNLFTGIAKFFGMQDLEVGEPEFDRDFVIQSNDEAKVLKLLQNQVIREHIRIQPHIRFEVRDDEGWMGVKFPDGVDELIFKVSGVIRDVMLLKELFELFSDTLNYLCETGSADYYDTGVSL